MSEAMFNKLRVFLSWSGGRSRSAAEALRDWLPKVLQNVKPYFTPSDIEKGARWSNEIRRELETTDFGVILLTRENVAAPWILFEAGALSKLEKAKVAPILLDLNPAEVAGPLSQLQLTPFSKAECHKLMGSINGALGGLGLEKQVLDEVFEHWWPDLESRVRKALTESAEEPQPEQRSDREMIEELLVRMRTVQARQDRALRPQRRYGVLGTLMGGNALDELPLSCFPIPERGVLALEDAGVYTLGELRGIPEDELLRVPNLGRKTWSEIVSFLKASRKAE